MWALPPPTPFTPPLVVSKEGMAKKSPRKPAWIKAAASYADAMWVPGRDQVSPRAGKVCAKAVYDKAGITDPWNEIQTAEIYVPFSWFEARKHSRRSGRPYSGTVTSWDAR